MPCEGRDRGGASTSPGMPKIASKVLDVLREAWNRFFLTSPEGTNTANTFISDF